ARRRPSFVVCASPSQVNLFSGAGGPDLVTVTISSRGEICIVWPGSAPMQRKSLWPAALFFALLGASAGCGSRPGPTTPPTEYDGVEVRVACPEGPPAEVLGQHARVWADRAG